MNIFIGISCIWVAAALCWQSYWRGYYQQKYENLTRNINATRPSGEDVERNIDKILKIWK